MDFLFLVVGVLFVAAFAFVIHSMVRTRRMHRRVFDLALDQIEAAAARQEGLECTHCGVKYRSETHCPSCGAPRS